MITAVRSKPERTLEELEILRGTLRNLTSMYGVTSLKLASLMSESLFLSP